MRVVASPGRPSSVRRARNHPDRHQLGPHGILHSCPSESPSARQTGDALRVGRHRAESLHVEITAARRRARWPKLLRAPSRCTTTTPTWTPAAAEAGAAGGGGPSPTPHQHAATAGSDGAPGRAKPVSQRRLCAAAIRDLRGGTSRRGGPAWPGREIQRTLRVGTPGGIGGGLPSPEQVGSPTNPREVAVRIRAAVLEALGEPARGAGVELDDPKRARCWSGSRPPVLPPREHPRERRGPSGTTHGHRPRGRRGSSRRSARASQPQAGRHVLTMLSPQCRECIHNAPRTGTTLPGHRGSRARLPARRHQPLNRGDERIRHLMRCSVFAQATSHARDRKGPRSTMRALEVICTRWLRRGATTGTAAAGQRASRRAARRSTLDRAIFGMTVPVCEDTEQP